MVTSMCSAICTERCNGKYSNIRIHRFRKFLKVNGSGLIFFVAKGHFVYEFQRKG